MYPVERKWRGPGIRKKGHRDIVGNDTPPTFNAAFVLNGVAVPGPLAGAGLPGLTLACSGLLALARRRRRQLVA